MSILYLDFETYYDGDYSLRKLAPPNYILDPRYETIGCAVKVDDGASYWVDGPAFADWLKQFDPAVTTTVTFNALFDNCILAWKYGFVPARMFCTMRMTAALLGHKLGSVSLANVVKHLQLGAKGDAIINAKGKRRADLMNDPAQWKDYQDYAINDNEMNYAIFHKLIPQFPTGEWRIMDRVLRCAVEPGFMIDTEMLRQHMLDLENDKVALIGLAAGIQPEDPNAPRLDLGEDPGVIEMKLARFAGELRSNDKFAGLLQKRGVDIEMKASATNPTQEIPAFAKTDQFMSDLLEHDDPIVQALAAARLGVRSTIEQTRGARIMSIAELPWPTYCGGNMPIPLRYSGAHTHRMSGDWSINMQNLPSGRGNQVSKLRKALIAPPDHVVMTADKAQIECRINAFICGQRDLVSLFAAGQDPYSALASKVFGFPVDKNIHKVERFIGKTGVLGLGFMCGAPKFYNMVLRQARTLGMDMAELGKIWDQALAQKTVDTFRETNRNIRNAWYKLDEILDTAWCGASDPVTWGPVTIGEGYVEGPGGLRMNYDVLPKGDRGHRYKYGKIEHVLYGGKFLENIVQFLARIDIMDGASRLWSRGYKFKLQAHDELVFIVPKIDVDKAKQIIYEEMTRPPAWAPTLPLQAEIGFGPSYGDAK